MILCGGFSNISSGFYLFMIQLIMKGLPVELKHNRMTYNCVTLPLPVISYLCNLYKEIINHKYMVEACWVCEIS